MALEVSYVYTYHCDRCQATAREVSDSSVSDFPDGWVARDGADLCPPCAEGQVMGYVVLALLHDTQFGNVVDEVFLDRAMAEARCWAKNEESQTAHNERLTYVIKEVRIVPKEVS